MIVELLVVGGVVALLTKPSSAVMVVTRFVTKERPKMGNMEIEGVRHTYSLEDFLDSKGEKLTDFAVAKILVDDGEVLTLLSRSELELLQQAALLDSGLEVNASSLRKIADLIHDRMEEVARAKSRRVTRG